jgi:hypothetical protein
MQPHVGDGGEGRELEDDPRGAPNVQARTVNMSPAKRKNATGLVLAFNFQPEKTRVSLLCVGGELPEVHEDWTTQHSPRCSRPVSLLEPLWSGFTHGQG